MLFSEPPSFIKDYVDLLNARLSINAADSRLSKIQRRWLTVCLIGIVSTNTICWSRFERASLGAHQDGELSWMFCRSPLPWASLLAASSRAVIDTFGLSEGVLVVDDSDRPRAKGTKKIPTYKVHDKKTGGYFNGQTIVALLLVTDQVTIPVGCDFYMPDPRVSAWKKLKQNLKSKGVIRKNLPSPPVTDSEKYPTKTQIAARLIANFKQAHPSLQINAILGDNHYGSAALMQQMSTEVCSQSVSVLKGNQIVRSRGIKQSVEAYFANRKFQKATIPLRGQQEKVIWYESARLFVQAHDTKRLVIAIRYEDQDQSETRYLVATELSWRTLDVIKVFTYRWLVEVFFEDLKVYEGWGQLAKQSRDDGSRRVLILSLLLDHCLLFYGPNKTRLENKQPAATVGSLTEHIRAQALFECMENVVHQATDEDTSVKIADLLHRHFKLKPSKKHLHGLPLGHQAPTPSLLRRFPPSVPICI